VPNKDPFKEFWNGKRLGFVEGDASVKRLTGVDEVCRIDGLWSFVERLAAEYATGENAVDHAFAFYYEKFKGDHNEKLKDKLKSVLRPFKMKVKSCADLHFEDRLVLEPERVGDAREAQKITDEAFRALLPAVKNFKTERDMALFLNYEMQRRSDGDLAFPTIAAGGKNACCLHYVKNDEPLRDGELILLDFGVRFGTLHSDISRTIPVNGKFNPLQRMLYEIVLESAKVYQRVVRPGVSLKEIGMICWEFIMMELDRRLVKGAKGTFKLLYDKRPHGVSHFIGEHIHDGDPGSRSLDVVLKPGMLISCEPGIYGDFSATIDGKRYRESIGIRIEDDLIITKNGFENISQKIPRTVDEIEVLMN
jgi:Xaa-Pro aminopeptidase